MSMLPCNNINILKPLGFVAISHAGCVVCICQFLLSGQTVNLTIFDAWRLVFFLLKFN